MQLKSFKVTDKKLPYEIGYQHDTLGEARLKRSSIPEDVSKLFYDIASRVMVLIDQDYEKAGYFGISLTEKSNGLYMSFTYYIGQNNFPVKCDVAPFLIARTDDKDIEELERQYNESGDEHYRNRSVYCMRINKLRDQLDQLEDVVGDNWESLSAMDFGDNPQTDLFDESTRFKDEIKELGVTEISDSKGNVVKL